MGPPSFDKAKFSFSGAASTLDLQNGVLTRPRAMVRLGFALILARDQHRHVTSTLPLLMVRFRWRSTWLMCASR